MLEDNVNATILTNEISALKGLLRVDYLLSIASATNVVGGTAAYINQNNSIIAAITGVFIAANSVILAYYFRDAWNAHKQLSTAKKELDQIMESPEYK